MNDHYNAAQLRDKADKIDELAIKVIFETGRYEKVWWGADAKGHADGNGCYWNQQRQLLWDEVNSDQTRAEVEAYFKQYTDLIRLSDKPDLGKIVDLYNLLTDAEGTEGIGVGSGLAEDIADGSIRDVGGVDFPNFTDVDVATPTASAVAALDGHWSGAYAHNLSAYLHAVHAAQRNAFTVIRMLKQAVAAVRQATVRKRRNLTIVIDDAIEALNALEAQESAILSQSDGAFWSGAAVTLGTAALVDPEPSTKIGLAVAAVTLSAITRFADDGDAVQPTNGLSSQTPAHVLAKLGGEVEKIHEVWEKDLGEIADHLKDNDATINAETEVWRDFPGSSLPNGLDPGLRYNLFVVAEPSIGTATAPMDYYRSLYPADHDVGPN